MWTRSNQRALAAVLLTVLLAVPAAGSAKRANTLAVKLPHRTRVGKPFTVTFSGTSTTASGLAMFLTSGAKCKRTYAAASRSIFAATRQTFPVARGSFVRSAHVTPASAGVHYVCGYLYDSSGRTLARAARKYHTKR